MNNDKVVNKIKLFRSLFKGREEIYARFWYDPKNIKSGYSPVYRLNNQSLPLTDSVIQTLIGFMALCEWCHWVKHIGLANMRAREGRLDYEKVVQHFIQVNQCDRRTFVGHREKATTQWLERSRYMWKINFGKHSK